MNELALFSGIGGISLGLKWAIPEIKTICHVERNPYCVGLLVQLMEKGSLDIAPIWDDVQTFDGENFKGKIDIVSGGFPCQDISVAGKGAGIEGSRSGMWYEMLRIIGEVRPRFVFVENVSALLIRGIDVVLGTLSEIGYDCQWRVISAKEVGALHKRERIFIVAYDNRNGLFSARENKKKVCKRNARKENNGVHISRINPPDNKSKRARIHQQGIWRHDKRTAMQGGKNSNEEVSPSEKKYIANNRSKRKQGVGTQKIQGRQTFSWCEDVRRVEELFEMPDIPEPLIRRNSNGFSFGVDRIKSLGNSVVPQCAEKAAKEMIIPFL